MEYFHGAIKSTKGRKGKSQTALEGVYKGIEAEGAKTHKNYYSEQKT